jgi:hypothetical protein
MSRAVKIAGLVVILGFIILQFFHPGRNLDVIDPENDLPAVVPLPDTVASVLRNSCYDCHSNSTDYPWYSNISPVSWLMDRHIRKGKEHLNMGEFGLLEKRRKISALTEICEVVESGSMPLKSYQVMHSKARISEREVEAICSWAESAALQILREGTSEQGKSSHFVTN